MTEDYYATLGVEPRSEAAAIRAAYHALMRLYHPDKNDSPAAIERAQAVIAAFAVLGDVEKRLHYDWGRRRAAEAAVQAQRSWLSRLPRAPIATAIALLLLAPLVVMQAPSTIRDRPVAQPAPRPAVELDPIRNSDRDAIAPPRAALAPIAVPKPVVVVEPVPAKPAAPQPRLVAEKLPLVPARAPRVPLPSRQRPQARTAVGLEKLPASRNAKCRFVKPGAEAAICTNDNLAALDRNVVTFYNQSLQFGAEKKRGSLLDSRTIFLARRDECRTDACLQGLHLTHLRELSAIMENRPPEPPQ